MPPGYRLTVLRLRPPPRPSATGRQLDLDWPMEEGGGGRGTPQIWGRTSSHLGLDFLTSGAELPPSGLWALFASAGLLLAAAARGQFRVKRNTAPDLLA